MKQSHYELFEIIDADSEFVGIMILSNLFGRKKLDTKCGKKDAFEGDKKMPKDKGTKGGKHEYPYYPDDDYWSNYTDGDHRHHDDDFFNNTDDDYSSFLEEANFLSGALCRVLDVFDSVVRMIISQNNITKDSWTAVRREFDPTDDFLCPEPYQV